MLLLKRGTLIMRVFAISWWLMELAYWFVIELFEIFFRVRRKI